MKKAFIICFCLIAGAIFSQDRKSLLSAALKNSNAGDSTFLLRDSVLAHLYYDAESDSMLLAGITTDGISKADIQSMMMQLANYKPHCWTSDSIPGGVIVPSSVTPASGLSPKKSKKAWTKYFTTHTKGYFEVSEPVFSKDGTYAIVYVSQQCGANCGNGGATLYHWEKGAWKPIKNLFSFQKAPH